jgi:hypothetical protein
MLVMSGDRSERIDHHRRQAGQEAVESIEGVGAVDCGRQREAVSVLLISML